MSVKIIIDSTADMIPAVKKKCGIVPLTIRFGEEDFTDGVTITHHEFYEKLVSSDILPTTSQPTPAAFAQAYEAAIQAGDQVVVITISAKLSGTYQSATIAAMDYPGDIYVVDSQTAALGTGILAKLALQLAESGMGAAEIAQRLTEERENIHLVAIVDTLEYLKKGGRISKTVAFAGELLSIKPIISVPAGEIVILGKARGNKQANSMMTNQIQAAGGVDFSKPFLLGYAGVSEAPLQKYIADSESLWAEHSGELPITIIGSVIGTHVGPGAVAAAFFAKDI